MDRLWIRLSQSFQSTINSKWRQAKILINLSPLNWRPGTFAFDNISILIDVSSPKPTTIYLFSNCNDGWLWLRLLVLFLYTLSQVVPNIWKKVKLTKYCSNIPTFQMTSEKGKIMKNISIFWIKKKSKLSINMFNLHICLLDFIPVYSLKIRCDCCSKC